MATCKQVPNTITGRNEWQPEGDDFDYHLEVANAGFGDMLHDAERNQKYFAALRKTIAQMHSKGVEAHVLDIGTGTGILSMMAIEAGADSVTACEAFLPMANCAERILAANGMDKKVRLIKKGSTNLIIGMDMPRKANLLVTEVLDTELIGEGAIGIYNHAHESLLTEDAICIPTKARCYAQVAESPLAAQWNTLKMLPNIDADDILLEPPKDVFECKGGIGLHDVQLSQLPIEQFRPITEPREIFKFDFNRKAMQSKRRHDMYMKSTCAGSTDLVFYWWDIQMDLEGEIILSCAPFWAHPDFEQLAVNKSDKIPLPNVVRWRDHWMQAIYYIPKPLKLSAADEQFVLNCNHDEFSLWFDIFKANGALAKYIPRHACTCALHVTYARSRIGQMNQFQRNKRYLSYLENTIKNDSHVLVLGDGCILGMAAAKLGAVNVLCHESQRSSLRFMERLAAENELKNVKFIDKLKILSDGTLAKLTHVFAEPYFLNAILPWDNFCFGSILLHIQKKLSPTVEISPHSARLLAVPVEFLDLHKIRTPVDICEGFDLSLFDKMVDISASLTLAKVEAQPLWEYPCRALAQPQEILSVMFRNFAEDNTTEGVIGIEEAGTCNGIAVWLDWHIDDSGKPKSIVSTGPTEPIVPGKFIKWDMFVRQGVHLLRNPLQVNKQNNLVEWKLEFKPTERLMNFHFDVKVKL